jgi:aspartate kinase
MSPEKTANPEFTLLMTDRPSSPNPEHRPIRVLKFGGTSVGAPESLLKAAHVIGNTATSCQPVVVVSAASGVTDDLVRAADDTRADRATADAWARHVGRRYRRLASEVLDDDRMRSRYASVLDTKLDALRQALQSATGADAPAARDAVLATGERLMAPLLAALLQSNGQAARAVDASSLIRTDDAHGDASVQWTPTREQIRSWFRAEIDANREPPVPVITGFIGGTADGTTTTLGRGGSDLSAALLARALEAERMERWTDVDGLYTRDPDTHDDARRLDRLDFEQARTWTKAGRLGMHPCTLDPLAAADIPIHVRCTHRPEAPGTRIVPSVPAHTG